MGRVKGGGGRRRKKGGVRKGIRMRDIMIKNWRNNVGNGKNEIEDMRMEGKKELKKDIEIKLLIGEDKRRMINVEIEDNREWLNGGVDIVESEVEEEGIDEEEEIIGGEDWIIEIEGSEELLVNDEDFESIRINEENLLGKGEDLIWEWKLLRKMNFWIEDIERELERINVEEIGEDIMKRNKDGEGWINDELRKLIELGVKNGRVGNKVEEIEKKNKGKEIESKSGKVRRSVGEVEIEEESNMIEVIIESVLKIEINKEEKVEIEGKIVLGIEGGNGVIKIMDSDDGRLKKKIGNMRRIGIEDRVIWIDEDIKMNIVIGKKKISWDGGIEIIEIEMDLVI